MASTRQLVCTSVRILIIEKRLLGVEKLTRPPIHAILQLLILHLIEVLKVDLAPARQLQRLEELEVEKLELVICHQRGLAHIENLLASVINHGFGKTH